MSSSEAITNEERSRREVAAFLADVPATYFAYQSHDVTVGHLRRYDMISTWTGAKLAEVESVGTVYRSNMGDRRQSFRAIGINGATYSGIAFLSAGDYVRMRKVAS